MSRREKRLRKSRWMSIGKHEKPTDENILQLITPSVLGIVLCMVCLAGMTWAWFTANSTAAVSKIEAAEYDVEVTVTTSSQSGTDDDNPDNVTRTTVSGKKEYTLEAGNAYKVTLTAAGTATKGYCLMELSEAKEAKVAEKDNDSNSKGEYYVYLEQGDSISFTIYPSGKQTMSFAVSWDKTKPEGTDLRDIDGKIGVETKSVANEDDDDSLGDTAGSGLYSDQTDTPQDESNIPSAASPQNPALVEDENNTNGTDDNTDTDGDVYDANINGTDVESGFNSDQTEELSTNENNGEETM